MARYRGTPTLSAELAGWRAGLRQIAGLDEVGRGPMAGPVVAAAVVLDPEAPQPWWSQLRDSKALSPGRRTELARLLRETAAFGIGSASSGEIDDAGLVPATRRAMLRALADLPLRPDLLLIDALTLPASAGEQRAIIHGDALCLSIAAASIVAKVARDAMMEAYDRKFPAYGFRSHRGYVTPQHLAALQEHGACPIHRRSFAPVQKIIQESSGGPEHSSAST